MSDPDANLTPWWLAWVVPFITAAGVAVMVIRKLLTQVVREDFAKMLNEKHQENLTKFQGLEDKLEDSRQDRLAIHEELSSIGRDVAYLRGLTKKDPRRL